MNEFNSGIPEEIAPEVLEIASRLYAETNNSYSIAQLQEIGKEVQIPPEIIEKAVQEVQEKKAQEALKQQQKQVRQQQIQIVAAGIGAIVVLWSLLTYNSLSSRVQTVNAAWAQVENQLQRKADLIPTLISLTQAQAQHEQSMVQMLTQSRQAYLEATTVSEKAVATQEMNQALQRFNEYALVTPQLQSSQAFINLQYEIAGTENRIATERMRYNQAVEVYNQQVSAFPNSVIAGITNFEPRPFFQARTQQ